MINRPVAGQLSLFEAENFNTQTRSKASLRPRITRKVLDEAATKLASLEPIS